MGHPVVKGVNDIHRFWHGQQLSDFPSTEVETTAAGGNAEDVNTNDAGGNKKAAAAAAVALGEGGHNRIFHTMGANDSLDGTTKTQIILSGTVHCWS